LSALKVDDGVKRIIPC